MTGVRVPTCQLEKGCSKETADEKTFFCFKNLPTPKRKTSPPKNLQVRKYSFTAQTNVFLKGEPLILPIVQVQFYNSIEFYGRAPLQRDFM